MKSMCYVTLSFVLTNEANIFILIDLRDLFQNFGTRGGNINKDKISKMDQSIEKYK